MGLKHSRDNFWVIDGVFKVLAIGCFCLGIYLAVQLFFYSNPLVANAKVITILGIYGKHRLTASEEAITATFCMLPQLLVWGSAFWIGSKIFYDLSEGITPFCKLTQKRMDWIAKSVLGLAIWYPIIYSVTASFVSGSFYFDAFFSLSIIVGLVLSSISEIFRYALDLQKLADETV